MEIVIYATDILAVRLGYAMLLVSADVLHVTSLQDKVHNDVKNGRQRSILNSELLEDISVLYMAVSYMWRRNKELMVGIVKSSLEVTIVTVLQINCCLAYW